jgi:hypothetical protein
MFYFKICLFMWTSSLCVSVSLNLPLLIRISIIVLMACPNPVWPYFNMVTSVNILLPNKGRIFRICMDGHEFGRDTSQISVGVMWFDNIWVKKRIIPAEKWTTSVFLQYSALLIWCWPRNWIIRLPNKLRSNQWISKFCEWGNDLH